MSFPLLFQSLLGPFPSDQCFLHDFFGLRDRGFIPDLRVSAPFLARTVPPQQFLPLLWIAQEPSSSNRSVHGLVFGQPPILQMVPQFLPRLGVFLSQAQFSQPHISSQPAWTLGRLSQIQRVTA